MFSPGSLYESSRNSFGQYNSDEPLLDYVSNYGLRSMKYLGNIGVAMFFLYLSVILMIAIYLMKLAIERDAINKLMGKRWMRNFMDKVWVRKFIVKARCHKVVRYVSLIKIYNWLRNRFLIQF